MLKRVAYPEAFKKAVIKSLVAHVALLLIALIGLPSVFLPQEQVPMDVVMVESDALVSEARTVAIRRMLQNLIDNALRYGKRCDLTLRRSGSFAEIIVDDEGPGIPEAQRDEVFKPFSRLEKSRTSTRVKRGRGGRARV